MRRDPAVVVVVGAGPSGLGVLERLSANAVELLGGRPLDLHVVDPCPPGPGRVWRHDQSPLLLLNTVAAQVTMFVGDGVSCAGPSRPGPSLAEWAGDRLTPTSFASRREVSRYLGWVYEQVAAGLPAGTRLHAHRDRAVDLIDLPCGRQRVVLGGGPCLDADAVVLALGHQDADPGGEAARLAGHAERHGLRFVAPGYAADQDLSVIGAGETVLVRGTGLAFVDLLVLLTEGRGGKYRPAGAGLRYVPGGREPLLLVGSRRGVPYLPKLTYPLAGPPPPLPRFFDAGRILRDTTGPLDFRRDLWPAAAREIGWGHYHELFTGHPERVRGSLGDFAAAYGQAAWEGPAMRRLVAEAVPDPADRLDIERLEAPLGREGFADQPALQRRMLSHLRAGLRRRADPRHSADLGAVLGTLSVFGQLPVLVGSGRLTGRSRARDVDDRWTGFVNLLASGPPPQRAQELIALAEAGVVRFIGPEMWLRADGDRFSAGSPAVPGEQVARVTVDARLPAGAMVRSRDPLVRALLRRGLLVPEGSADGAYANGLAAVDPGTGAVLDAAGCRHPRRFALGPFTSAVGGGNFTRPGQDPPASRLTDALARAALGAVAAGSPD